MFSLRFEYESWHVWHVMEGKIRGVNKKVGELSMLFEGDPFR
jgi:hypothetical protein